MEKVKENELKLLYNKICLQYYRQVNRLIAWRNARVVDWSGLENRRTCERT